MLSWNFPLRLMEEAVGIQTFLRFDLQEARGYTEELSFLLSANFKYLHTQK
jgi:hypothetical protein